MSGEWTGAHTGNPNPTIDTASRKGGQATPDETPVLKTQKDQVNYAIGVHLIGNFKRQGVDIDLDLVIKGMRDAYSGGKLLMSDGDLQRSFMVYQSEMRRTQSKIVSSKAEQNRECRERSFWRRTGRRKGLSTLPSGLQYEILRMGEGKKPTDADSVECHYRGTFINGKEFDNSYKRGGPVTFKVKGVIPGWAEALKLMPVGSKWRIFVPSELAYGERGAGDLHRTEYHTYF